MEWISVKDRLPIRVDEYPVVRYSHEDGGWYGRNFAQWDGKKFLINGAVLLWIDAPLPTPLPEPPKESDNGR